MKTNCDVCNRTHYCYRTGRIYRDSDGHWQIKLHTICLIDEEVEKERDNWFGQYKKSWI